MLTNINQQYRVWVHLSMLPTVMLLIRFFWTDVIKNAQGVELVLFLMSRLRMSRSRMMGLLRHLGTLPPLRVTRDLIPGVPKADDGTPAASRNLSAVKRDASLIESKNKNIKVMSAWQVWNQCKKADDICSKKCSAKAGCGGHFGAESVWVWDGECTWKALDSCLDGGYCASGGGAWGCLGEFVKTGEKGCWKDCGPEPQKVVGGPNQ